MAQNNIDLQEVKELITHVERTKEYDCHQIIGLHNRIFNMDEDPDACESCLRIRMMQIKAWYQDQNSDW